MATPDRNASDLDRANATITELASHLDNFKQACEKPSLDPSTYERLQQLRRSLIYKDLENFRESLDSVSNRLRPAARDSTLDAAELEKKQATLDRAIQAAEKRDQRLDKREERLDKKEEHLEKKEERLDKREERLDKKEEHLEKKEERLEKMEERLEKMEERLEKMMEAVQRNSDTAVAIDRINSGAGDSANSSSMNELMGGINIAAQAVKTIGSDLSLIQRFSRKLVAEFDSTGKRPLSSGVEPTGKRARSVGPVLRTGSPLDKEPSSKVSSDRMIMSPTQFITSITPGPSGASNQLPLLPGPVPLYGLNPGFRVCPREIRDTDDETRRVWTQISFGAEWTMTDSVRLLQEFDKYVRKGVIRQMPQRCLDRCAEGGEKCLFRDMLKHGSNFYENEDAATKACVDCSRKSQICIRVVYVGDSPGEYNRDATNVKRWNVTKRQL